MQVVGREAPGDVGAARSWSPVASQFLPILEESRSSSADARALAPLKATGGVAAPPEPGSCPRPRAARRARVGEPLAPYPLHPLPAPHHHSALHSL